MDEMKVLTLDGVDYVIRDGRIGNLTDLQTAEKESVVGAVNALNATLIAALEEYITEVDTLVGGEDA